MCSSDLAALVLPSKEAIWGASAFALALLLLQAGVLRRSRWARIALMALFTVDAFARLVVTSTAGGDVAHSLLVGAGASALGVMAISSDASRQWVQTLRLDARGLDDQDEDDDPDGSDGVEADDQADDVAGDEADGQLDEELSGGAGPRDGDPARAARPRTL